MRASTGEHYLALDQVRALAAFLVFAWHFLHGRDGSPVPFAGAPAIWPLAVLDEGHTGVALFMTLSGYLFAKLLRGRRLRVLPFLANRALRLLPLLVTVIVLVGIDRAWRGEGIHDYAASIVQGVLYPTWPNGGWSIAVEFHFYLLLPLLLGLAARRPVLLLLPIVAALLLRAWLHQHDGEVQSWAYWTMIGRIDQFCAGMLLAYHAPWMRGRHGWALVVALLFTAAYAAFDAAGGWYGMPAYPSPSRVWIVLPTLEAVAYALLIAWYDTSFQPRGTGFSGYLARLGEYSYSIYLLHFFVVFELARWIDARVMDLSNFYLACVWAVPAFLLTAAFSGLSYRWLESPFLRLRRPYAGPRVAEPGAA